MDLVNEIFRYSVLFFCIAVMIWLVIYLVVLLLWFTFFKKRKSYNCFLWILNFWKKFPEHPIILLSGSIFYISIFTSLCLIIIYFIGSIFKISELSKILDSSAVAWTFVALVLTIITFVNIWATTKREKTEITNFPHFLVDVSESIDFLKGRLKAGDQFFMVDFTPAVGSITARDDPAYDVYFKKIIDLCGSDCQVNVVCYSKKRIQFYHAGMGIERNAAKKIEDNDIKKLIEGIESPEHGDIPKIKRVNDNLWRLNEIGPTHLISTPYHCFQYIVLPKPNGGGNEIAAIKRQSAFFIDLMQRTFREYVALAVTPINCCFENDLLVLEFTPQNKIANVKLFLCARTYFNKVDPDKPSKQYGDTNFEKVDEMLWKLKLSKGDLGNNKYLRVILEKNNGELSPLSQIIEIPVS